MLFVITILTSGCQGDETTQMPNWTSPPAVSSLDNNRFHALDDLGVETFQIGKSTLLSGSLSYKNQHLLDKALAPELEKLKSILSQPVEFQYRPQSPFVMGEDRKGWGLLGKEIAWRISDHLSRGENDAAIENLYLGIKLGQVLCGGDAADAILGDGISDQARQAILLKLDTFPSETLEEIGAQLAVILSKRPLRAITAQNEHSAISESVQTVQDMSLKGDSSEILSNLGPTAREGCDALDAMPAGPNHQRLLFFKSLNDEGQIYSDWLQSTAILPTSKRLKPPVFKITRKSAWSSFTLGLMTTGSSWLKVDDQNLARTRLLVLYAIMLAEAKKSGAASPIINKEYQKIDIDPYTSQPFFYVPKGTQFLLYSAGENCLDDGGETDSTRTTPDLFLETPEN